MIVGGGPTGIELAGGHRGIGPARDGRGISQDRSGSRSRDPVAVGPAHPAHFRAALSSAAERSLQALGVVVRLDTRVLGIDSEGVDIGGQRIAARTVLWAVGVAASPAAQWLKRITDPSGRLAVGADLSVPDLQRIYAIGDTASCLGWRGAVVLGLAPAAKQQGLYVAGVIAASLAGRRPPPPFRYRHFGSLATIGRQAAVAEIGKLRVWGEPAWWFWGAIHIAILVGGRNRAIVILDWLWAYLTYRRSTRLITGNIRDKTMD